MREDGATGDMLPRWPVFVRLGDQDEVKIGDAFADTPAELLVVMAQLLRATADDLEARAARLN